MTIEGTQGALLDGRLVACTPGEVTYSVSGFLGNESVPAYITRTRRQMTGLAAVVQTELQRSRDHLVVLHLQEMCPVSRLILNEALRFYGLTDLAGFRVVHEFNDKAGLHAGKKIPFPVQLNLETRVFSVGSAPSRVMDLSLYLWRQTVSMDFGIQDPAKHDRFVRSLLPVLIEKNGVCYLLFNVHIPISVVLTHPDVSGVVEVLMARVDSVMNQYLRSAGKGAQPIVKVWLGDMNMTPAPCINGSAKPLLGAVPEGYFVVAPNVDTATWHGEDSCLDYATLSSTEVLTATACVFGHGVTEPGLVQVSVPAYP
jgi:hypothetical protein